MKNKVLLCIILYCICCCLSGCSVQEPLPEKNFQVKIVSSGESVEAELFHLDSFAFDQADHDPEVNLEFQICGESFYGEYIDNSIRLPFLHYLAWYKILDVDNISGHKALGWAWIEPKTQKVVIYTSLYEAERDRNEALSEDELKALAQELVKQYIDLDLYSLTISQRNREEEKGDYVFAFNRSINGVAVAKLLISLTTDGHLAAFQNLFNEEWNYAITQNGIQYYEEQISLLTSEEAQNEIASYFEQPGISDWEIKGKTLILLDETHVGAMYTVSYSVNIGEGEAKQSNSIQLLLYDQ